MKPNRRQFLIGSGAIVASGLAGAGLGIAENQISQPDWQESNLDTARIGSYEVEMELILDESKSIEDCVYTMPLEGVYSVIPEAHTISQPDPLIPEWERQIPVSTFVTVKFYATEKELAAVKQLLVNRDYMALEFTLDDSETKRTAAGMITRVEVAFGTFLV